MVNQQLLDPRSIVVVGASNNTSKPGGKIFHNIRTGTYRGKLYALNPKEDSIQGLPSFRDVKELPETDLAILAIPASLCLERVKQLASTRRTRAFIIISAGFSEESREGARIEQEIVKVCRAHDAALIGPNCIGVMTPAYQGVFTLPIPPLDPGGCDFISGSGATAVFIMESGLQKGLRFNHVFSVGNSASMGVEDVLAHFDSTYVQGTSSPVKILYFETIKDPAKLLEHATSLIRKGCRIAAVKAGTTEAGSRAASSHTGALASPDLAVDALFRKAGIVRCYGREELTTVACAMMTPPLKGKNMAIITHAGGPAVMLTDVLAKGGMDVPHLEGPETERLLSHLYPGSSAANPIDLLATGNAEQVGISMEFCEKHFSAIDGIVVIFGTPGLSPVFDVYEVMHEKMKQGTKPVFPVLPSVTTARDEVQEFLGRGHINFPDEVLLGEALTRIYNTPAPGPALTGDFGMEKESLRSAVRNAEPGYLDPERVAAVLDAAGIGRVPEAVVNRPEDLEEAAAKTGYPLVMKVVGPVHKSDVGGVVLGIGTHAEAVAAYRKMEKIKGFEGVLLQSMVEGTELFAGLAREEQFGHMVLCGLGGIFVEALQDIASGLAPLGTEEALRMIRSLKGIAVLEGTRGTGGVDLHAFAEVVARISRIPSHIPEIEEMDLNPILGRGNRLVAVDARIRTGKPVL